MTPPAGGSSIPQPPPPPPPSVSHAQYTTRDLLLYAVGIGCCCSSPPSSCADNSDPTTADTDQELRYAYERHEKFQALPTFPLALSFTATPVSGNVGNDLEGRRAQYDGGIRPFPPYAMRNILPRQFIRTENLDDDFDVASCPIVDIARSLRLHHAVPLPPLGDGHDSEADDFEYDKPVGVTMVTRIVSVEPKSIGAFVTTEAEYWSCPNTGRDSRYSNERVLLFTGRSEALVVGVPNDAVVPFQSHEMSSLGPPAIQRMHQLSTPTTKSAPSFTISYLTSPNQALMYRLSGDYNAIHVDAELAAVAMGGNGGNSWKKRPVLHGLCTLGFAIRGVLAYQRQLNYGASSSGGDNSVECDVTFISCSFARPAYVGDAVKVVIWDDDRADADGKRILIFEVRDEASGKVVIKNGVVELSDGGSRQLHHSRL